MAGREVSVTETGPRTPLRYTGRSRTVTRQLVSGSAECRVHRTEAAQALNMSGISGFKGSRVQIPPSRQLLQVRGHITSPVSGLKIF
jgi:hypothetical protein